MQLKILVVVVALISCSKIPPPIADGKCVVDRYEENKAVRQQCIHAGYLWVCDASSCDRKGEAVGEVPK